MSCCYPAFRLFTSAATLVHKTLLFVALCCDHEDDHAAAVIFCATPMALFARLVMCVYAFGFLSRIFHARQRQSTRCSLLAQSAQGVRMCANEFRAAAPEFNPPINYAARN